MRRKIGLLSGYLSIGLPDEQILFQDPTVSEIAFVKKAIWGKLPRDPHSLTRLNERAKNIYERSKRTEAISRTRSLSTAVTGDSVLYVAHETIVKKTNGYTVRTHSLLRALVEQGVIVHVLARPQNKPAYDETVDGVTYMHLGANLEDWGNWLEFEELFENQITTKIQDFRPKLIQAASNHITGRSALNAAQKVGLPFIYEVRGFWHVTRQSSLKGYIQTAGWAAQEKAEAEIIHRADHTFTLNNMLKSRSVRMGGSSKKISILQNCGSRKASIVKNARDGKKLHLGYIGSVVAYEGIDILITAISLLSPSQLRDIQLDIYGGGDQLEPLKELAHEKNLTNILFHGEFINSDENLGHLYASIDLIVLPRVTSPVTTLVTPMKPFEAAAYKCPLLVADVLPLIEFADQSGGAITFKAGNPKDLARKISGVQANRSCLDQLSTSGHAYIHKSANWHQAARHMIEVYGGIARSDNLTN